MKKYEFTGETKTIEGIYGAVTVRRIRALVSFGAVKAGECGGWLEKEENLSQDGKAWIYGEAKVYGEARVYGNAKIRGNVQICDKVEVCGNAVVSGNAMLCDTAKIYGNARVCGNTQIYGAAQVYGNAFVYGKAEVCGNTQVYGLTAGGLLCLLTVAMLVVLVLKYFKISEEVLND